MHGIAGVIEHGDAPLLEMQKLLQEAVFELNAAGEQVLAADDVAGLVERAELLIPPAAHALIAPGEEADRRRQLAELARLGMPHLEAGDEAEFIGEAVDQLPLRRGLEERGVGQD